MAELMKQKIAEALRAVAWQGADIVTNGMVAGVTVGEGGKATVVLQIVPDKNADMDALRTQVEKAAGAVEGVASVAVVLTAHQPSAARAGYGSASQGPPQQRQAHGPQKIVLPGVKFVVAVASGKGGVGKSTTAVNLAVALAQMGLKIGLLDADIYGPSIPRMLGISGKPEAREDKKLIPHERYGMAVMSMGFLVPEDTPMVWRGPMVHSAITQLFRDVDWGVRDILVVDLPPGTGDAQLTMAQSAPLSGAVIVSTPQDIALIDARKGIAMFEKTGVPVLGVVENMSMFVCPHCGTQSDIFGHGGARTEAEKLGAPFLGEVPLDIAIRIKSDEGVPMVLAEPGGAVSGHYKEIAEKLWQALNV
ncbi:MAG: Mrp/NBP35 family ATP-binding protein [Alphaproteobacteria bacterium]|nr:Mrp/NBP35 family ATP-binding protein [Alphaproteobacteria bacterium]